MNSLLIENDCFIGLKSIDENSIDLVFTSPPYADTISYGDGVKIYDETNFHEWFIPIIKELHRVTKPTGSFILNINDKVVNGERSIYVFDLVCRIVRETGWNLHDRYIWHKKSGLPSGGSYTNFSRLDDKMEYIFHFVKTAKNFKTNIDNVREPYAEISVKRMKNKVAFEKNHIDENGIIPERECVREVKPNKNGKIPSTVFRFNTSGTLGKSGKFSSKHPAAFHPDMPRWFVKYLTDPGDKVLDPFMGSGTTAVVCEQENREWIGMEINPSYISLIKDRILEEKNNAVLPL